MMDPTTLEGVRARQDKRRNALITGQPTSDDWHAAIADLEWLLEEATRMQHDNERLARLVGDISQIVSDAKEKRRRRVAEAIRTTLQSAEEEELPEKH